MNDKPIMLIQDNPDDRDLTIRALKRNNVLNPIAVASNGAEALTMLFGDDHRDQGNPALILLDLKLPKVGGARSPPPHPRRRADPGSSRSRPHILEGGRRLLIGHNFSLHHLSDSTYERTNRNQPLVHC